MIYKVEKDIISQIVKELPFLRFNETQYFTISEQYYAQKENLAEIPWKSKHPTTCHRQVAQFPIVQKVDFEKDVELYKTFTTQFFDQSISKTFEGLQHFLLRGLTVDEISFTEVADWTLIQDLLSEAKYIQSVCCNRLLVRIPCGPINLNITELENDDVLYLEITGEAISIV